MLLHQMMPNPEDYKHTSRPVSASPHCHRRVKIRHGWLRRPLLNMISLLMLALGAAGQTVCDTRQKGTIACLVPNVINAAINTLDPGGSLDPRAPTGDAVIVVPLASSLPIPSPASGFVYAFDNSTGAYIRSSQTFGPILAERFETIGRNKAFVGFTFQRFVFDKLDGVNIHDITTIVQGDGGEITNHFNLGIQLNQFTIFATYGVTNRLDISLAIPISTAYVGLSYNGVLRNRGTGFQSIPLAASGRWTASGFGDVNLQVKGTAIRSEHAGVAFGVNLRLPTGNEYQALGSGSAGIEPFIVASTTYKRVTPHINFGYRRNGESILAGNVLTGIKSHIPSQVPYAAGADIGVTKRVTLALDILGLEVIHGDRLTRNVTYGFDRRSYNVTNGSAGFKLNPVGNLLFVANLLFPLNDGGLRSKVVPMIGLSYAF
jgi:hypothetical protein